MSIKMRDLPLSYQIRVACFKEEDQQKVLSCSNVEESKCLIDKIGTSVRLDINTYNPIVHVSGSSIQYKTKNLFTEFFKKDDVVDFMNIAELPINFSPELIIGELEKKIKKMINEQRSPLQCLVYATKKNERTFYNNNNIMELWAKVIADTVNNNPDFVHSINHMLVNWEMWKNQIKLLIIVCGYLKPNPKLDEVIRNMYSNHEDDSVRYTVMKRLLKGIDLNNFICAFTMLKSINFIDNGNGRKYFGALKKSLENARVEKYKVLEEAFGKVNGFSNIQKEKIAKLFGKSTTESEIVRMVNESPNNRKAEVLKDIKARIFGKRENCNDVAFHAKDFIQYRVEIQKMFINKINNANPELNEIKIYGIAIGNLDYNGNSIDYFSKKMSSCNDKSKKLIFSYLLAFFSDSYVDDFVNKVLDFDGSTNIVFRVIRKTNRGQMNQFLRMLFYKKCIDIKEYYGLGSQELLKALNNLGEFLFGVHTVEIYDIKFDQLLFEFVGYDTTSGAFEPSLCNFKRVKCILNILSKVMDKNNYNGRYIRFMGNLFDYIKNINNELAEQIDNMVRGFNNQGIPAMQEE